MKKIKLSSYPYGRITKRLEHAVEWLNSHPFKISNSDYEFDYPEYCDMPKALYQNLSSDEVDFIQEQLYDINQLKMELIL